MNVLEQILAKSKFKNKGEIPLYFLQFDAFKIINIGPVNTGTVNEALSIYFDVNNIHHQLQFYTNNSNKIALFKYINEWKTIWTI